jgi:hypothetical protein
MEGTQSGAPPTPLLIASYETFGTFVRFDPMMLYIPHDKRVTLIEGSTLHLHSKERLHILAKTAPYLPIEGTPHSLEASALSDLLTSQLPEEKSGP